MDGEWTHVSNSKRGAKPTMAVSRHPLDLWESTFVRPAAAHMKKTTNSETAPVAVPAAIAAPSSVAKSSTGSPLLDLAPELRNQIYGYVFAADALEKSGLAPHALTRVNRQLRGESLEMYYARPHTIEVPLLSPKQVDYFVDWARRSMMQLYTVPPRVELYYSDPGVGGLDYYREGTLCCMSLLFSPRGDNDTLTIIPYQEERGSTSCIALPYLSGTPCTLTAEFTDISQRPRSWLARCVARAQPRRVFLSFAAIRPIYTFGSVHPKVDLDEVRVVGEFFAQLAKHANDKEWDMDNLVYLADFLTTHKRPRTDGKMMTRVRGTRILTAQRQWQSRSFLK